MPGGGATGAPEENAGRKPAQFGGDLRAGVEQPAFHVGVILGVGAEIVDARESAPVFLLMSQGGVETHLRKRVLGLDDTLPVQGIRIVLRDRRRCPIPDRHEFGLPVLETRGDRREIDARHKVHALGARIEAVGKVAEVVDICGGNAAAGADSVLLGVGRVPGRGLREAALYVDAVVVRGERERPPLRHHAHREGQRLLGFQRLAALRPRFRAGRRDRSPPGQLGAACRRVGEERRGDADDVLLRYRRRAEAGARGAAQAEIVGHLIKGAELGVGRRVEIVENAPRGPSFRR